jgi:hypothetical protein
MREIEPQQPTVHIMPMWEPADADPEKPQREAITPHATQPELKPRGRPRKLTDETARIAADPFDPNDDGATVFGAGAWFSRHARSVG